MAPGSSRRMNGEIGEAIATRIGRDGLAQRGSPRLGGQRYAAGTDACTEILERIEQRLIRAPFGWVPGSRDPGNLAVRNGSPGPSSDVQREEPKVVFARSHGVEPCETILCF